MSSFLCMYSSHATVSSMVSCAAIFALQWLTINISRRLDHRMLILLCDSKPRVDRLLPTCVTGHVMHVVRGVSRDGDYPWNGAQKPVCTEIDFILRWHFKMKIYRCGCSLCLKRFSFTNTQPPSLTSQCAWDTVCAAFKNLTRLFMKACYAQGRETYLWLVISSTFISLSSVYSPWRLNTC